MAQIKEYINTGHKGFAEMGALRELRSGKGGTADG